MKVAELLARWAGQAALLEEVQSPAAKAFLRCARELEAAIDAEAAEPLTLDQAAAESGYDKDSLGRFMRAGQIPNAGQRHAPRIRRGDLPRKPPPPAPDLTAKALMRIVPAGRRKSS